MQEVIRVEDYTDRPNGRPQLLKDLFDRIKSELGEKHENDDIREVLSNPELLQVYFDIYDRLKAFGVIVLPTKTEYKKRFFRTSAIIQEDSSRTPCGLSESEAKWKLELNSRKRKFACKILYPQQLEVLDDESIIGLDLNQMKALVFTNNVEDVLDEKKINYLKTHLSIGSFSVEQLCALKRLPLEYLLKFHPISFTMMDSDFILFLSKQPFDFIGKYRETIKQSQNRAELFTAINKGTIMGFITEV